MCTEELVSQVSVTVLDVDELEPRLARHHGRTDEPPNDRLHILIAQDRILSGYARPSIEQGVMIQDPGLRSRPRVGPGEPARVGELQPDEEIVAGAERLDVSIDQRQAQV